MNQSIAFLAAGALFAFVAQPAQPGEPVFPFAETARLDAGQGGDGFGSRAGLDGDRAVVGTSRDQKLYIYEQDEFGLWRIVSEVDVDSPFGNSFPVAISGDWVIAGQPDAGVGSALLVQRQPDGTWLPVQELTVEVSSEFGGAVAIDEDRLVVSDTERKRVHFYERDVAGQWNEVALVEGGEELFGRSASLDGDRAIFGGGGSFGAAHIYERDPAGEWIEVASLAASDGPGGDFDLFGDNVALSGDWAMVSDAKDDQLGVTAGALYIYHRDETGFWSETEKWVAPDGTANEVLGKALSLSGSLAVATTERAQYLIGLDEETMRWRQVEKFEAPDLKNYSFWGNSASLSGRRWIVGAPSYVFDSGLAFIYQQVAVDPKLGVVGECPGEVALLFANVTPQGPFKLWGAEEPGQFTLPGNCSGVELDLDQPTLVVDSDFQYGRLQTVAGVLTAELCGQYVQVVDETTCTVSNVAQVPE